MEPKKPKKKIGLIIAVILVLAAAGGGLWYFLRGGDSGSAVYVMPVSSVAEFSSGNANRYSGVVESQQTVDYKLDSNKTVKQTFVEAGDVVHVGDILFSYDTDTIRLDIAQKKLDIQSKQAEITSNNEMISLTQEDLEKQRLRNENMQLEYEIKALRNELAALEASLENADVVCTVDGTVKSVSSTNNNGYNESDVYVSVMKSGDFVIKGKINEMNLSQVPQGTKVVVRSRVDDSTWDGFVSKVDTGKTASGENEDYYYGGDSSNQSSKYYFFIELSSSEGLFLGQHVVIELAEDAGKSGLWLYEGYLFDIGGDNAYVWADHNGKIKKQQVRIGSYDEETGSWEITDGLTINDSIAFPDETVKEGTKTTTEYVYNEPEDYSYEDYSYEGAMTEEYAYADDPSAEEEDFG